MTATIRKMLHHYCILNTNFILFLLIYMIISNNNTKFKEDVAGETSVEEIYSLIVWNDEINTFEWVIETLMDICGHTMEQAEQCAMIIHTKGKYAVKEGRYTLLKPMCDAITERGIGATIEVLSS